MPTVIRKKPVELEAFIVNEDNATIKGPIESLPWWAVEELDKGNMERALPHQKRPYIKIKTLEGDMIADVGDYIVQGVEGEIYPIKPHIVAQLYEHVNSKETK